jgi:acyl transferase domain-containing protein/acyl carrier protein
LSRPEQPDTAPSPLRRALLKIEELQGRVQELQRRRHEPLAIVGMACRFPGGSSTTAAFWQLLSSGSEAIGDLPADRWDVDAYYDPKPGTPGKMYVRRGAFLDGIDGFDPQHFGIAPREAISMDPQQRLLLEVTWEALEDAGCAPDRLIGSRTGVFVGICRTDYSQLQIRLDDPTRFDAYYGSGGAHSIASGRLSYVLGLQGPSVSIDTACSSSLVAIHLASQSLRTGECAMAIVGGVNLILSPENTLTFCQSTMVSADGRCRTFDAAADGFGQGEGCGVIVIKRLSDAIASGDRILALVRGTAVNQDGASSGLTAPNGPAQEAMLREALAASDVAPHQVGYIEAHGTGTPLGDPIEVQAIGSALRDGRDPRRPVLIGSVKTNIGHVEAAAGLAGVIKVVLALQHRLIPPHLHFRTPNPHIPWDELPVQVATTLRDWEPIDGRRIAGVSSFGFSGTNAHVVIEEAPGAGAPAADLPERPLNVCVLSARSDTALSQLARRYAETLASHPEIALSDICYTAGTGRAALPCRAALVAGSTAELAAQLNAVVNGDRAPRAIRGGVASPDRPKLAFLFTGQGSQYVGMGRRLFEVEPAFRDAITRCDAILRDQLSEPLLSVLYPETDGPPLVDQTAFTQPALFAVEYALAEVWASWGVRPTHVMGHSVGEYVAACVAGVLSLEDGLGLIAARARAMQALPPGGRMAAVFAPEARVVEALAGYTDRVSVAAINGPEHVVVSGDGAAVERIVEGLQSQRIRAKFLNVSHAFHSPLMKPVVGDFRRAAAKVQYARPRLALISNLTGNRAGRDEAGNAEYWCRHILEPVRFADSVATLRGLGCDVVVEIGPDPILLGMAAHCPAEREAVLLPSLRRGEDDVERMLTTAGRLYCSGVEPDWTAFADRRPRQRIALPTYPFQRERYWLDDIPARRMRRPGESAHGHPLLGGRVDTPRGAVFTARIDAADIPFLADHVVHGRVVLPTTAYLEMAAAAGGEVLRSANISVEGMTLQRALSIPSDEDEPVTIQLQVTHEDDGRASFELHSRAGGPDVNAWLLHAAGTLRAQSLPADDGGLAPARQRSAAPIDTRDFYRGLRDRGLHFGARFTCIESVGRRDGEAVGEIGASQPWSADADAYRIHPARLDACLQVLAAAAPGFQPHDATADIYMPVAIDRFVSGPSATGRLVSRAWFDEASEPRPETRVAHVRVYDEAERLVAAIDGLQMKRVDAATLDRVLGFEGRDWFYEVEWREVTRDAAAPRGSSNGAVDLGEEFARLARQFNLREDAEADADREAVVTAYIVVALRRLGWDSQGSGHITTSALAERLGVAARYERLLGRLLEILAEDGHLARERDGWRVLGAPGLRQAEETIAAVLARAGARAPELAVIKRCGDTLADALRGQADPLDLLFPGGDVETTARIYNDTPAARTFNTLCAEAVRAELGRVAPGQPLRILEIGAGTGGTTTFVLDALPPAGVEYTFTDIGQAFLTRAARRFADRPFIDYRLLDIERDPVAQGFAPGAYDVIIASNVLHATVDIRTTLRHAHALLSPRGVLLLLEGTRAQRWFDMTFGLTDGWWRFTDHDVRPSHPLLAPETWLRMLSETGFVPAAVPAEAQAGDAAGYRLFVAAGPQRAAQAGSRAAAGCWIVLADQNGVGEALARTVRLQGDEALVVWPGVEFDRLSGDTYTVDPCRPDHFTSLVRAATGTGRVCRGAVHLWPADAGNENGLDTEGLSLRQRRFTAAALHLAQALMQAGQAEPPALWLVTRGAQSAGAEGTMTVSGAPVWGLAKVIQLEHPDVRCVRVDLDASPSTRDADQLLAEIAHGGIETEIAFRGDRRLSARLVRARLRSDGLATASPTPADDAAVELQVTAPGSLDSLRLRPAERRTPGAGQIEIRVRATGLNFRDVLNALGARGDTEPLGGECAGIVTRIGPGVNDVAVGDAVVAIAAGAFSTYALLDATLVCRKPERLPFDEAAGVPLAYLTAEYALHEAGALAPGERVLIHAAAGGVGLAAVRLAQRAGAEVFATAGSPEKRRYLESIGVKHVMDSRTTDFAGEVMRRTSGAGVDIVLNSLTGDAIPKGLSLLRSGGRFLEIGKAELWDAERVASVNPRARYVAVDLAATLHADPARVRPQFLKLVDEVSARTLEPLPVTRFDLPQASEAFRFMARARHIGKIVLTQEPAPARARADARTAASRFRADATYLITGGFGGLGLEVARWMAAGGARHLALMGRTRPSPEADRALEAIRQMGTEVSGVFGDVSNARDVEAALAQIRTSMPPLAGIVHAAGVLRDNVVLQQTWERFAEVLAPKVEGAWNLHRLSADLPLEMFVLFSSVSSLLGSPGQSNHAAANAFLDQLAHYRRRQGRPAISINWGAWTEVGAAAARGVAERIAGHGIAAFSPTEGLRAYDRILQSDLTQVGVAPIDWQIFATEYLHGRVPPFLTEVVGAGGRGAARPRARAEGEPAASADGLLHELERAAPPKRRQLLAAHIERCAVRVLGLNRERPLDRRVPLAEMGLDSLMAVELRNALASAVGRPLPATLLFDYPTVDGIAAFLAAEVLALDGLETAAAVITSEPGPGVLEMIEDLSDEDVERMLAERMERHARE